MLKQIYIVIIACLLFVQLSYAQDGLEYYSSIKCADTLNCFGDADFDVRVYCFVDETNCYTCTQSLVNVSDYVNKAANSQIIAFYTAKHKSSIEKFIEGSNWKYEVVHDLAGAYRKLYQIKQNPFMIIADNSGKVYYTGVPGNAKLFDIVKIKKAIADIKINIKDKFAIEGLNYLNSAKLKDIDGKEISEDLAEYEAMMTSDNKNIIISSLNDNKVFLFDSTGKELGRQKLNEFGIYRHALTLGNITGRDIYIYSMSDDMQGVIYKIDVVKHTADSILKFTWDGKNNSIPWTKTLKINDTTFVVNTYQYIYLELKDNPTLFVRNCNGNISRIGYFDQIYRDYNLSSYIGSGLCTDKNNNICQMLNLSDTLRRIDLSGKIINEKKYAFDTVSYFSKWRESFQGIVYTSPIEKIKDLRYKISTVAYNNSLLYDKYNDFIYLVYQNKITDSSGTNYFQQYLNLKGAAIDIDNDVKLPLNSLPVGINNRILSIVRRINNVYYLVNYSF